MTRMARVLVLRCAVAAVLIRTAFVVHGFAFAPTLCPLVVQRRQNKKQHRLFRFHSNSNSNSNFEDQNQSEQQTEDLSPRNDDRSDTFFSNEAWCMDMVMDRRTTLLRGSFVLPFLLGLSSSLAMIPPKWAEAETIPRDTIATAIATTATASTITTTTEQRLSNELVQSLVFDKVLGSGSYKTVYLVSATLPSVSSDGGEQPPTIVRYAMAVQILNTQKDVRDAFRGVLIPSVIQQTLNEDADDDKALFETIVDWWVQPNAPEFATGQTVFPKKQTLSGRTRTRPKQKFSVAGIQTRWMVSFKPVYEIDLERFIKKSPTLVPVGSSSSSSSSGKESRAARKPENHTHLNSYWTEASLLQFVLEILHAGTLMHAAKVVHKDIKPKNIMVTTTVHNGVKTKRPVLIDYGYSDVGRPVTVKVDYKNEVGTSGVESNSNNARDICVDGETSRGCQKDDACALGKTLYEFVFGDSGLQVDDLPILTLEGDASLQNDLFRNKDLLFDDATAGSLSRFPLSREASRCLLVVMRGLCGNQTNGVEPLTISRAEMILSEFILSRKIRAGG